MPAEPALEITGLEVTYGGTAALRGVTVSVRAGELLALLGPSGSGKTTLLHAVAGFLDPAAGTIRLAGPSRPSGATLRWCSRTTPSGRT